MAEKMVEKSSSTFISHLGTFLVLCALATCGTSEQHVAGWLGQELRLPCDFTAQSDVVALYWTNSGDVAKTVFLKHVKQQRRSFDERFALDEDFSLVISNPRVSDEGRYTCRVELDSGESLVNHMRLTIYALASIPHIKQCVSESLTSEDHSSCTVETSITYPLSLDCRVTGFRPDVTLEWSSSGIVKQPTGELFQRTRPDGTFEREVTISITANPHQMQRYTCTVTGDATNGTDRSATVTVLAIVKGVPAWVKIVFDVLGFTVFVVFLVIFVVLRCQADLKALRTEIKKYTFKIPGNADVKAAAHIGLFGVMGAGKSSFMNSLEFSLKGTQSQPTGERGTQGTHSIIRGCFNLTDHISLYDNRGMKNFSLSYVDQFMKEIGDQKEEPNQSPRLLDEEIHCPVFVYKYMSDSGKEAAMQFLDKFASRLRGYNGYQPLVVVTHADSLSEETKRDLKKDFSGKCKEVWFFENYINSVEIRAKSIQFLKFLKAALHQCEVSVVNSERWKKVKKPKKTWWQWFTRQ